MVNLCFSLLTKEREILIHFNLTIQNYLSEKENIKSHLIKSNILDGGIRELGDYLENLLYGKSLNKIYYNEILYILDLENYDCSLEKFKNNFKKCISSSYKISNSLKDFLNSIKMDINEEVGKKLGLLKVKDNLIDYDSENDNLYIHHITHTHLHRPEISENTKKIIDEIYASCLNYSKLKFK